ENDRYKHIIFVYNETDKKGAGVCRNIGLEKSTGDWILFADSDDYFVKGFYKTISKYFQSENEVVFFTPTSINVETGKESTRHAFYKERINNFIEKQDIQSETSLRYRFYVPWSKLIKANFLRKNKIWFEEVIASNDLMFSTYVGYYMKKFDVSNEVIYSVSRNKGSLTVNYSERVYDARLKVYINYCNFLKSNLDKRELKCIDLTGGIGFLITAIKYRYGIKKVLSTYLLIRKSNVKILDSRYFNPIFIIKKIVRHLKTSRRNKKFIVSNT